MAGPGPREATYAASAAISSSVNDRALARDLGSGLHQRHPAGADLEVDGGGADADQGRAELVAVLGAHALAVLSVAERAADQEELPALGDQLGVGLLLLGLRGRRRTA